MLSELSGSGPVLLALTGRDESLGRVNWKKVRKVAAWTAAPGLMATIAAAKAAKAAAKRVREKNIERLKIERANRAAKLAEARKRQADAEAAAKQAQRANAAIPAPSPVPQYEAPVEEIQDSPDAPAENTEMIPESSDEGSEESAEVMGYARSNDDYFVGAPLKRAFPSIRPPASGSGQLRVVKKAGEPDKKILVVGAVALGAFLFRKQLKKVFRG